MDTIQDKWDEANANPGKKVLIGSLVVCDICDKDYTTLPDQGGFVFGSKGYCPNCASRSLANIKGYGEERYIRAYCPDGVSFADFIREYRGEDSYISVTPLG